MHPQPLAYRNQEFLESEEARPLRILAEYLEPLRRFKAENIQDTVVFFGSARIHSREQARKRSSGSSGDCATPAPDGPPIRTSSAAARRSSGRDTTRTRASWRGC